MYIYLLKAFAYQKLKSKKGNYFLSTSAWHNGRVFADYFYKVKRFDMRDPLQYGTVFITKV